MVGFVNFNQDSAEIEAEIVRKGIALGIDWDDEVAVRALAREAVHHMAEQTRVSSRGPVDYQQLAKIDLFGLAGVMLKMMEESAGHGIESHGGPAWKAFARALWAEAQGGGA